MNTHTSYTHRQSADEMYDGDWDDLLRPDEYEDILDQKRFQSINGTQCLAQCKNKYL